MLEELRARLNGLSEKIERTKKIDAMLKALQSRESELRKREHDIKSILVREEKDVDRLERTTATSLFYSLFGQRTERLNKEQMEAYAAKLKYDAAVRQLDDCRAQMADLQAEKQSNAGCDGEYRQVFAELRSRLSEDPSSFEKLGALERQRGGAAAQIKELNEALDAGYAVMAQIHTIEDSLRSAENWGTWDLLGGGLLSDIEKHSKLDEAQEQAEQLQLLLSRFHAELADIRIDGQMAALNINGFQRFADFFFDGLIADWSALTHIHESQDSVLRVKRQVSEVLEKLTAMKAGQSAANVALEQEISDLVTGKTAGH